MGKKYKILMFLLALIINSLGCSMMAKGLLKQYVIMDKYLSHEALESKSFQKGYLGILGREYSDSINNLNNALPECKTDQCRSTINILIAYDYLYLLNLDLARKHVDISLEQDQKSYLAKSLGMLLLYKESKFEELETKYKEALNNGECFRDMHLYMYYVYKTKGDIVNMERERDYVLLTLGYYDNKNAQGKSGKGYRNITLMLMDEIIKKYFELPVGQPGKYSENCDADVY